MHDVSGSSGDIAASRAAGSEEEPRVGERVEDVSLLRLGAVLLRGRRALLAVPLAIAAVVVLVSWILGPDYRSGARFVPQNDMAQMSRLADVASQFGFSLPTSSPGQSPSFYAELLESQEILRRVVETEYVVVADGDSLEGDLVELYAIDGDTPEIRTEHAVERLREDVDVDTDTETGLVSFSVVSPWAQLAHGLAERLLAEVEQFNVETRQSQAAAKREFTARRLEAARAELRSAEDRMETFLEQNRSYQESPRLRLEYQRLQRRVDLHQQVVSTLAQSLEQAKIEEVRDTPVITVMSPPRLPAEPEPMNLLIKAFLALVAGLVLTAMFLLARATLGSARVQDPDDYEAFRSAWVETKRDAAGIWKSVRGRLAHGG